MANTLPIAGVSVGSSSVVSANAQVNNELVSFTPDSIVSSIVSSFAGVYRFGETGATVFFNFFDPAEEYVSKNLAFYFGDGLPDVYSGSFESLAFGSCEVRNDAVVLEPAGADSAEVSYRSLVYNEDTKANTDFLFIYDYIKPSTLNIPFPFGDFNVAAGVSVGRSSVVSNGVTFFLPDQLFVLDGIPPKSVVSNRVIIGDQPPVRFLFTDAYQQPTSRNIPFYFGEGLPALGPGTFPLPSLQFGSAFVFNDAQVLFLRGEISSAFSSDARLHPESLSAFLALLFNSAYRKPPSLNVPFYFFERQAIEFSNVFSISSLVFGPDTTVGTVTQYLPLTGFDSASPAFPESTTVVVPPFAQTFSPDSTSSFSAGTVFISNRIRRIGRNEFDSLVIPEPFVFLFEQYVNPDSIEPPLEGVPPLVAYRIRTIPPLGIVSEIVAKFLYVKDARQVVNTARNDRVASSVVSESFEIRWKVSFVNVVSTPSVLVVGAPIVYNDTQIIDLYNRVILEDDSLYFPLGVSEKVFVRQRNRTVRALGRPAPTYANLEGYGTPYLRLTGRELKPETILSTLSISPRARVSNFLRALYLAGIPNHSNFVLFYRAFVKNAARSLPPIWEPHSVVSSPVMGFDRRFRAFGQPPSTVVSQQTVVDLYERYVSITRGIRPTLKVSQEAFVAYGARVVSPDGFRRNPVVGKPNPVKNLSFPQDVGYIWLRSPPICGTLTIYTKIPSIYVDPIPRPFPGQIPRPLTVVGEAAVSRSPRYVLLDFRHDFSFGPSFGRRLKVEYRNRVLPIDLMTGFLRIPSPRVYSPLTPEVARYIKPQPIQPRGSLFIAQQVPPPDFNKQTIEPKPVEPSLDFPQPRFAGGLIAPEWPIIPGFFYTGYPRVDDGKQFITFANSSEALNPDFPEYRGFVDFGFPAGNPHRIYCTRDIPPGYDKNNPGLPYRVIDDIIGVRGPDAIFGRLRVFVPSAIQNLYVNNFRAVFGAMPDSTRVETRHRKILFEGLDAGVVSYPTFPEDIEIWIDPIEPTAELGEPELFREPVAFTQQLNISGIYNLSFGSGTYIELFNRAIDMTGFRSDVYGNNLPQVHYPRTLTPLENDLSLFGDNIIGYYIRTVFAEGSLMQEFGYSVDYFNQRFSIKFGDYRSTHVGYDSLIFGASDIVLRYQYVRPYQIAPPRCISHFARIEDA